jgi:hypothetical protein
MGVEASYQAIPEDCDLLIRARKDVKTAGMIGNFHRYAISIVHPTGLTQWIFTVDWKVGLARQAPTEYTRVVEGWHCQTRFD